MDVRQGLSKPDTVMSGTYDGITINTYMVAAAANTALVNADFKPENVSVKVILKTKDKKQYIIMQDNLLVLGTFNSLCNGYHDFVNGIDKVYPAGGVFAVKLRQVFLSFGGHIRVSSGDELTCEISLAQSITFTTAVNTTDSYLQFNFNPSIGYMYQIPTTTSKVVQAGQSKERFNLGENVTKILLLNFDQNTLATEVLNNVNIASDKLDLNMSYNQVIQRSSMLQVPLQAARYGTSLPISAGSPSVVRGLNNLPQSFILFNGEQDNTDLDNCTIDVAFNGTNVAASQNWMVWRSYQITAELLADAQQRQEKHAAENISKKVA